MYIQSWLLITIVVVVSIALYSLYRSYKHQKAFAINNYKQWGKMRYEFECTAKLLIIERSHLCDEMLPELVNKFGDYSWFNWIHDPKHWQDLSHNSPDYYELYDGVREEIYRFYSEYDYADVMQDINYFEVYRTK
ncbi:MULTISPECIES: hypothetical protein [Citrobacter]|uniref:hypothetical protein n=1 Tax=Citrobacter TaxID=544 RepID=UPI001C0F5DBE|nr:hypothetical protein [Citrobacter sp. S55_ASV_140]MBU5601634.1 hypothetical protein [Citrobacter sp. S55_ASV_140]